MQGPSQDTSSHQSTSLHSGSAGYEDSPRRGSPTPPQIDGPYNQNGRGGGTGGTGGGGAYAGGMDAIHNTGQLPPPPSRAQHPPQSSNAYSPQSSGYGYDDAYGHGAESHSSLAGLGGAAVPPGSRSPSHRGNDGYTNDPYQGLTSRNDATHLGVFNPNEIADDGDDGLEYHRGQRTSMLSLPHSDRSRRAAAAAAAAGAGGGAAAGAMLSQGGSGNSGNGDFETAREKPSEWLQKNQSSSKKWRWVIIIIVLVVIIGAIVGGVVGSLMNNKKKNKDSSSSSSAQGDSADEDEAKNGDLNINSAEIKKLLNNADLHKVFPGMDYTPLNTQYPACIHNPASQNNVTRDVAVLSQLTNKIRLYGTDCNQTQMLLHAIDRLELKDTKVWLGVWQDNNETTNARQLDQMWDILDEYGQDPFEGIIVANEILFREEMTETELGSLLDDVRTNLTKKKIDLPVATSDLGDDWTSALAQDSDYIMANIHPFFAGVTADKAAGWTYSFWENQNKQFWKTDKKKNIISETGWPTSGGTGCGAATSCTEGSVAGIDELNTFMEDWVCAALKNGTNYFWFEAFDEPWKVKFNTKGKAWEDQWGLLTVNRELKDGVKIPDCDGQTVD